jgi:hypothetical protein
VPFTSTKYFSPEDSERAGSTRRRIGSRSFLPVPQSLSVPGKESIEGMTNPPLNDPEEFPIAEFLLDFLGREERRLWIRVLSELKRLRPGPP